MAKASQFQWRYFLRLLQAVPVPELTTEALKNLQIHRWSGPGGWLLVVTGAAALVYWNGRLVTATGVGVAVMMLVYLMHDWKLDLPLAHIRKWLSGWNQPIVLSVTGGGIATLTTYLAASIWMDSESPWIASGAILQGLGTLAVLVLLSWQTVHRQASREQAHFNQMLTDLTHADPVKRLLAVRQLTKTVLKMSDNLAQRRETSDYFRLMLSQEQEPIIYDAVLDSLQRLDQPLQLQQVTQPTINLSMNMKHKTVKARKPLPMR